VSHAPPLLSLRGVSHTFANGTRALEPVDLSVDVGQFISIVGPSGCGKSTLLKIASRLITPIQGTVIETVSTQPGDISFVFQDATLMPWANVINNVGLPLALAGVAATQVQQRSLEALSRVGLADFADAYPRELSGGMKMRVSIARAVVTGPRLLLMDEPFAALDEFTRFKLNDDLRQLWSQNRWTVIFVTHSVREAVFLSERVLVMSPRPGRIVDNIHIGLPTVRSPDVRLSHAFADECARVTQALDHVIPITRAA
jgi:NitT/TauT family transport system ATP-binding protein